MSLTWQKVSQWLMISGLVIIRSLMNPSSVLASAQVTEVFPHPIQGGEWVELFNDSQETIDLQGWNVEDQLSTASVIYTWPSTTLWAPQTYLVIDINNKLNNSGDGVTLKNAIGEVVDSTLFSTTQEGLSWTRIGGVGSLWQWQSPSPASPNPAPTPTPTPTPAPLATATPLPSVAPTATPTLTPMPLPAYPLTLMAREILACPPSGQSEWLEIYNPETSGHSLDGWRVRDASDNTRIIAGFIQPLSTQVIGWTGSLLNNTGDSLSLETPTGQVLWEITFAACPSGQSWSLVNDRWQFSSPTPGQTNLATVRDPSTATDQQPGSETSTNPESSFDMDGDSSDATSPAALATPHKTLDSATPASAAAALFQLPALLPPTTPPPFGSHLPVMSFGPLPLPIGSIWSAIMGGVLLSVSCGALLYAQKPVHLTSLLA